MSFTPKKNYQLLKAFQLRIDLNSPRFASKIPSSQEEAIDIISNSDSITPLMQDIEEHGLIEPLVVVERQTKDVDKFTIIDGIRRYVCLDKLKKKYLKEKIPFPINFTRIPCLVKDQNDSFAVSIVQSKDWDSYSIAKYFANLKKTDILSFNRKIIFGNLNLKKIERYIDAYELMQKYKNYFDPKSNKNLVNKTEFPKLFSFFEQYISHKKKLKWLPEKQFVEDIASGKIERAIDVRTLVQYGSNKEFIEQYTKLKSTEKLVSIIEQFQKVNSTSRFNQIDYLQRKSLQYESIWTDTFDLVRHLDYKNLVDAKTKIDSLPEKIDKGRALIQVKAYEEFSLFIRTLEVDDKCFESKEFNKEIIKGFKTDSLNESQKNDFINLLAGKFFEYCYRNEKLSKLYDFSFKEKTKKPFSFYLRKGKFSNFEDLEIIKEIKSNSIALELFVKTDAKTVSEKITQFSSTDTDNNLDIASEKINRVYAMILTPETKTTELKSSFSRNLETNKYKDPIIRFQVLKTVNAFLNTVGGTLIIGVRDNPSIDTIENSIIGIENDDYENDDKYVRGIDDLLKSALGLDNSMHWEIKTMWLPKVEKKICIIECGLSKTPVFISYKKYIEAWNQSEAGKNKKYSIDKKFSFKRDSGGSSELVDDVLFNYFSKREKTFS